MKKIILVLFLLISVFMNKSYPIGQCQCFDQNTECGILIDSDEYINSDIDIDEFIRRYAIIESRCENICNENSLSFQAFSNYGAGDIEHLGPSCHEDNQIYQIFPSQPNENNINNVPDSDSDSDGNNDFGFDDIFDSNSDIE